MGVKTQVVWTNEPYQLLFPIPLCSHLGFQKELTANCLQFLMSSFKWATIYSLPKKAALTALGQFRTYLNFQIQWNYNSPSFNLIDLLHSIPLTILFFRKLSFPLLFWPWSWSSICVFPVFAGCFSPFLVPQMFVFHWILFLVHYYSVWTPWSNACGFLSINKLPPSPEQSLGQCFTLWGILKILGDSFLLSWWMGGRGLLVFRRQGPGRLASCNALHGPSRTIQNCSVLCMTLPFCHSCE